MVIITNFVFGACVGCWLRVGCRLECQVGRERGLAQTLPLMVQCDLWAHHSFPSVCKGVPPGPWVGPASQAAEIPPGGSLGVQQEADGAYTRMI